MSRRTRGCYAGRVNGENAGAGDARSAVDRGASFDQEAEEFFHRKIPITRAMGVRVVECGGGRFAIAAPVALNHNHHNTAFGGSINAVATLAGYGLLWLQLRDQPDVQLVISSSSIRFLRPVRETICATCTTPAAAELQAFHAKLRTRGKAALTLHVRVEEHREIAAEFTGTFVAVRADSSGA
jgi:thioesterase domain-containing protein